MNYHIFPQDKFFSSYIEDIYKLHQESNNIFWVRGNCGDFPFFKTSRPVAYIGNEKREVINKLRTINKEDKLIVSWYDIFIGECILESGISNRLYVYLMGGDFYNDPPGYHYYWLFQNKTKKIVKKLYYPPINFHRKPKNWYKIINEIKTKRRLKETITQQYTKKLATIARIDNIITTPNNPYEIDLIKKLYPAFNANYIDGVFNQNVDQILVRHITAHNHNNNAPLKILLGNSADPTNNHLDACILINKMLRKDFVVYSPLSYGDSEYASILQKKASRILGKRFQPITEFMSRDEYIDFIDSMDIVIMNHHRQQAYGNIVSSLMLGKPVFMKKNNAIYQTLSALGIKSLYNIDDLNDRIIQTAINNSIDNIQQTQANIYSVFSEEKRLQYLLKFL